MNIEDNPLDEDEIMDDQDLVPEMEGVMS